MMLAVGNIQNEDANPNVEFHVVSTARALFVSYYSTPIKKIDFYLDSETSKQKSILDFFPNATRQELSVEFKILLSEDYKVLKVKT